MPAGVACGGVWVGYRGEGQQGGQGGGLGLVACFYLWPAIRGRGPA